MADKLPDIVYELPLGLAVLLFYYVSHLVSAKRHAWTHQEEQIAARLSPQNLNGRVAWEGGFGNACLAFENASWGGTLRVDNPLLRLNETWTFFASTTRPMPSIRVEGRGISLATSCDDPALKSSFDLQVAPLLLSAGKRNAKIAGRIGAHRIQFTISTRKGRSGANLLPMLDFVEALMAFVKDLEVALAPNACLICGGPGADEECERCHTPDHAACHSAVGVCRIWGCAPKRILLDALAGPAPTKTRWV